MGILLTTRLDDWLFNDLEIYGRKRPPRAPLPKCCIIGPLRSEVGIADVAPMPNDKYKHYVYHS